ncbi:MAG: endonuclease domain-containing protein [Nitrospirae bacterium]|nr:endonuclease domain-containing protein [Nitrospirota bacterium]
MGNRITILGKALRKTPTDAEQLLWSYLRMKQMEGLKFRRQQSIDKYIVNFVCFENRIIIEVDGGRHAAAKNKDIERENYLQRYGFKVLRFWNNEALQNTNEVLAVIRENCLYHPPLTPSCLPLLEGERLRKGNNYSPPVKGEERKNVIHYRDRRWFTHLK